MKINGVENPCAHCGRSMPRGGKMIKCQLINNCHGDSCDCYLEVGESCYKILTRKVKVEA